MGSHFRDMESEQVSHLLSLAEAMSAAQEKATGNGKLDMAGIMAAMAMAQGGSRGADEGIKEKDSIYAGRTEHNNNLDASNILLPGKEISKRNNEEKEERNDDQSLNTETMKIMKNSLVPKNEFGSLKQESTSIPFFSSPKPYKRVEEQNDNEKSLKELITDDNKLADIRPVSRADIRSETDTVKIQDNEKEKKSDKDDLVDSDTMIKSKSYFRKEPKLNLSNYLDQSDPGIVKLTDAVASMFATKEEMTGNGKLELSDLVLAVASIIQNDEKATEVNADNLNVKNYTHRRNNAHANGRKKSAALMVNIGGTKTSDSMNWARQEAIVGAAVAKGVAKDIKNKEDAKSINPDPTVRKLVYSQYREMLKNFSNN